MRILLTISIFLIGLSAFAGVVILDQSGQGDYTTFTDAFNNSTSGDTIYIVGSAASYGNVTINSPRIIIGNGYFGQSLGYQPSATLGNVTLNTGAATSKFLGLTINTIVFNEGNLTFENCNLSGNSTIGATVTNVGFEKCYFRATLTVQATGVSIENSIFNIPSTANALTTSGGVETQLSYVTFYDGNLTLDTAIVNNCVVNSSLVSQTQEVIIDGQFGNKVDIETNLLFTTEGASTDQFFQLQAGSSALVSSDEGAESGAFGFPSAQPTNGYVLSGLPAIPQIVGLSHSTASNSSSNLDISVQATANQNISQIAVNVFYEGSSLDAQTFNGFTSSQSIDEVVTLNTSTYGTGIHHFSVEVVDINGLRSMHTSGTFLQEELIVANANVTDLEYFFDAEPGEGLATQIVISPSSEITLSEAINTSSLSEGYHNLYLRAKDQTGRWGGYQTQSIYIERAVGAGDVVTIGELEYFVDTDPGAGAATTIIGSGSEVALVESLDLASLSNGFHTIYLRGKLQDGAWGPYSSTTVYVESSVGVGDVVVVDALEYFIDEDPGEGLATAIASTPSSEVSVSESIDLTGISTGFHTLYLRGKLQSGAWGPYTSQTIYVEASGQVAEQITEIEYFFDTDPGVGNALEVTVDLPAADINEMISLSAASLGAGNHTVSIRAKDESGSWGHYFTQEMEVLAGSLVESIADGNWDDPSTWSGGILPGSTDSVVVQNIVTLNVPTDTVLALTIAPSGSLDLGGNEVHVRGRFTAQSGGTLNAVGGSLFMDGGTQTYSHQGDIIHGALIFAGSGTKRIDYQSDEMLTIFDSLVIESEVDVLLSQSLDLVLVDDAKFINKGLISGSKWSLSLDGFSHDIDGGDFENVVAGAATTVNFLSDFNVDGIFNSGGLGSVFNLGFNEINLGDTWTFNASDELTFSTGGRLVANKAVSFLMEGEIPLTTVNIPSGAFDALGGTLTFASNQLLNIEQGTVDIANANFSGSGGISLTGGSLNVINGSLTFGNGSILANDGGSISIAGSSSLMGTTPVDNYSIVNNSGSIVLNGTAISELGGLGLAMLGGTLSMTNVSFTNGLGVSYITFDAGFDGTLYEGIFFEPGPTFNVSINDGIDQTITFDQYGGSFGGPNFDNPGSGAINWTNPQGVGSIIVNTPSGGEELNVGDVFEITWTTENVPGTDLIEINLSTDGGETYSFVNDGTFDTYNGSFNWTVPDQVGTENVIQIVNTTQGISAESNGLFTIVEVLGSITIITPNGGEELVAEESYEITWSVDNIDGGDPIEISWSQDGGETFEFIDDGTFDTYNGVYNWTVPSSVGTDNQIQITNLSSDVSDVSDGSFSIIEIGGTPVANEASNVTSTSFTASWSSTGTESYFVDVSTESDFASFVTGYEDVATSTTSLEVTGLDFRQSYYYRVRSDDSGTLSDNSNVISVKTIIDAETIADSTALVQIYNSLGGPDWTTSVNWETARLRDWDNVDLDEETRTRVEVVNISGVGAFGNMPNPFTGDAVGGLSLLLEMNASNNQITGLMDFSETTVSNLNVSGNQLEFDDLEPIVGISTLDYSNQASIQFNEAQEEQIEVRYTNDYNLSITTGGSANLYQWKRNGANITTSEDFMDNGSTLDILSIDYDNMGEFTAEVTSSLVSDLTISVDPQKVLAVADFEVRVLGGDDQPIAENVKLALLEAIKRAKGYDTLEVEKDVSSTFTFPNVVLGDYLTAVSSDPELYIDTYSGDVFQWEEADTIFFRDDRGEDLRIQEVPPERPPNDGKVSGTIETDFAEDEGRIDARRAAARRKCGLTRKRGGGRTDNQDDEFELIAYGETNDKGEFEYGDLPQGTYRFFVEYPGIPLDPDAYVQFDVGEAGISDTEFVLAAVVTEDGISVELIEELGIIFQYFKNLQIYPNPSSDVLNISYRHLTSDAVKMELVDLTGTVLVQKDLQRGYDRDIALDVTPFETGIYLLRLYDSNSRKTNVITYRIVIQN